jgi:methyl-accepting chemotaxis protein
MAQSQLQPQFGTSGSPVRARTFLLVAVPLALPLAFTLFFVPYRHETSLRQAATSEAATLTALFAANASAPMEFDDAKALTQLLSTASSDPEIVYMLALGPDGRSLASYGDDRRATRRTSARQSETWESDGQLNVSHPVVKGATHLGTVQVGFSTSRIAEEGRAFRSIAIVLSLVVLLIAAGMAFILGRGFSNLFEQLRRSLLMTAEQVSEVVQQLGSVTAEQTAAAGEESSALNESHATANEVGQAATVAAQRASALIDGGVRAEEGAATGLAAVSSALEAMRNVRDQMGTIVSGIAALSERATAIGEIASTVALLAERSNLLALNAAIEAARAGTQGRGFSVVAQEMRGLAEGSNRSVAQVKVILTEIQTAISRTVNDTREGERRVINAEQLADRAGESIRKFATATRDFAQVGKEIASSAREQSAAIEQLVEAIANATDAGTSQLETTKQVEETTRRLRALSLQMLDVVRSQGSSGSVLPERLLSLP